MKRSSSAALADDASPSRVSPRNERLWDMRRYSKHAPHVWAPKLRAALADSRVGVVSWLLEGAERRVITKAVWASSDEPEERLRLARDVAFAAVDAGSYDLAMFAVNLASRHAETSTPVPYCVYSVKLECDYADSVRKNYGDALNASLVLCASLKSHTIEEDVDASVVRVEYMCAADRKEAQSSLHFAFCDQDEDCIRDTGGMEMLDCDLPQLREVEEILAWGEEFSVDYVVPVQMPKAAKEHQCGLLQDYDGVVAAFSDLDHRKRHLAFILCGNKPEAAALAIERGWVEHPAEWTLREVLLACGICEMEEEDTAIRQCARLLLGAFGGCPGVRPFALRRGEDSELRRVLGGACKWWPEDLKLRDLSREAMSVFPPPGNVAPHRGHCRVRPTRTSTETHFAAVQDREACFEAYTAGADLARYSFELALRARSSDDADESSKAVGAALLALLDGEAPEESWLDTFKLDPLSRIAVSAFSRASEELRVTDPRLSGIVLTGLAECAIGYAPTEELKGRIEDEAFVDHETRVKTQELGWREYAGPDRGRSSNSQDPLVISRADAHTRRLICCVRGFKERWKRERA